MRQFLEDWKTIGVEAISTLGFAFWGILTNWDWEPLIGVCVSGFALVISLVLRMLPIKSKTFENQNLEFQMGRLTDIIYKQISQITSGVSNLKFEDQEYKKGIGGIFALNDLYHFEDLPIPTNTIPRAIIKSIDNVDINADSLIELNRLILTFSKPIDTILSSGLTELEPRQKQELSALFLENIKDLRMNVERVNILTAYWKRFRENNSNVGSQDSRDKNLLLLYKITIDTIEVLNRIENCTILEARNQ